MDSKKKDPKEREHKQPSQCDPKIMESAIQRIEKAKRTKNNDNR